GWCGSQPLLPPVPSWGWGWGWGWYETLSSSVPVLWMESGLVALQALSGLPWWSTVIAARTASRRPASLLSWKIYSLKFRVWLSVFAMKFQFVQNNRSGLKNQPGSISGRILRELSQSCMFKIIGLPFKSSFPLWLMDLAIPDSTWILLIILGTLNLLIVEIFKYATNFFRGTSVFMIPIAAMVPSSIALYWMSSSFMGLVFNLLLHSPAFHRLCHIPWAKSHSDTPYRDIVAAFCVKYFLT
uniref:Uncharacterized protein n=1 Tax=Varanus komodoensis TaxID=61221 RepID=A0A8D2INT8_VARKO